MAASSGPRTLALRSVIAIAVWAVVVASCTSPSSDQSAAMQASESGDQKTAISLAKKDVARFSAADQCSRTTTLNCGTLALAYGSLAGYQILDGERRWRAAKLAGLKLIPIAVREVTRGNELALQLIANQQRQNLTALEEAAAYRKAVDSGQKAEDLAQRLGLSRATVFGRLRLNELDAGTRKALEEGTISVSVANLAAMVPEGERKKFVECVGATQYHGPTSYKTAQETVERYVQQLDKAGFSTKEPYPVTGKVISATCDTCPKRSGNMEGCGLKRPNVCTEPSCFEAKTKAAAAIVIGWLDAPGARSPVSTDRSLNTTR